MNTAPYLSAPFAQGTVITTVTTNHPAPVAPLPPVAPVVAPGQDDTLMIFLSSLAKGLGDGASLVPLVAQLTARAPQVGAQVVAMGNLGRESWGRAVETLRIYRDTRVIQPPTYL